jgi:methionine-rich copper-binding protein CopC
MATKPTATLRTIQHPTPQTETDQIIAGLEAQLSFSGTYSAKGTVLRKAINKLKESQDDDRPAGEQEDVVDVTMPKSLAAKLYSLLGHVRKQDGFNELFDAFDNASFPLLRPKLHLDFVAPGVLLVDDAAAYRKRTGQYL